MSARWYPRPPVRLPDMAYRCRNEPQRGLDFVSDGVRLLAGLAPADFAPGGKGWSDLVDPGDLDRTWQALQQAGREDRPFRVKYRIRGRDGALRWVWDEGRGVRDGSGTLVAFEGFVSALGQTPEESPAPPPADCRRLAAHLDRSGLAVIEQDAQLRIVRWSRGAERLFGWSAQEALGCRVDPFSEPTGDAPPLAAPLPIRIHEGDLDAFRLAWAGMLRGSDACTAQVTRIYRKDGRSLDCEWHASAIRDRRGGLASVLSQILDVTDRKRTEAALRERTERYELIAAGTCDAIWDWDIPNRRVYYSPRWKAMRGLADDEVSDREEEWTDRIDPEHAPRVMAAVRAHFAGESPVFAEEYRIRCRDGSWKWILDRGIALRDAAGRPIRMAGSESDITDRRLAQEALLEADRRKNAFLATLAHELRNPLAPIRNAAEILRLKGPRDPTLEAAREIIDRQLVHLVRLIDDLLDLTRIARGRLQMRREPVTLGAVLDRALETARPRIERAGHTLELALPSAPIWLDGDPIRLAQVFQNLLDNACKYTEPGGRIGLAAELDGGAVRVRVADTGIGIAPEHLPGLFDMFAQVGTALERSQGGLGIGLALARGLVEMHGGSIAVHSEGPGRGSEFTVRLAALAPPPAHAQGHPRGRPDAEAPAARRILVVDDNPDTVDSLALLLRLAGHEVLTARDGPEAVAAARRHRPDLILLDIGLPGLDGYGVCRGIRSAPWGQAVAIVALTGWGQEDDRQRTREAGFDGHLVKPVEPAALRRLLAQTPAGED